MPDFNDPYRESKRWRRVQKARKKKRRAEAQDVYELQMREAVIRWTQERIPDKEIAKRLGQTIQTIGRYRNWALERAAQRALLYVPPPPDPPMPDPETARPYEIWEWRMKYDPEFARSRPSARREPAPRALRAPGAGAPSDFTAGSEVPPSVSGEILESQDVLEMRAHCLRMKKAAVPYEKMAEILGISKKEAQTYCRDAIAELQESEQLNADLERRLMIEQIDQMIAAIHAPATGENILGYRVTVVFEAIDRMLRLMKQKADLLGLSAPPAVDIRIKLQGLASESGYDIVDLEEIAREVLQAHKLKLPEFR